PICIEPERSHYPFHSINHIVKYTTSSEYTYGHQHSYQVGNNLHCSLKSLFGTLNEIFKHIHFLYQCTYYKHYENEKDDTITYNFRECGYTILSQIKPH